jgi:hypothetical protein
VRDREVIGVPTGDGEEQEPGRPGSAPAHGADQDAGPARINARLQARLARHPAGARQAKCGDPPPPELKRGIEQFNHREYFECH